MRSMLQLLFFDPSWPKLTHCRLEEFGISCWRNMISIANLLIPIVLKIDLFKSIILCFPDIVPNFYKIKQFWILNKEFYTWPKLTHSRLEEFGISWIKFTVKNLWNRRSENRAKLSDALCCETEIVYASEWQLWNCASFCTDRVRSR